MLFNTHTYTHKHKHTHTHTTHTHTHRPSRRCWPATAPSPPPGRRRPCARSPTTPPGCCRGWTCRDCTGVCVCVCVCVAGGVCLRVLAYVCGEDKAYVCVRVCLRMHGGIAHVKVRPWTCWPGCVGDPAPRLRCSADRFGRQGARGVSRMSIHRLAPLSAPPIHPVSIILGA